MNCVVAKIVIVAKARAARALEDLDPLLPPLGFPVVFDLRPEGGQPG